MNLLSGNIVQIILPLLIERVALQCICTGELYFAEDPGYVNVILLASWYAE